MVIVEKRATKETYRLLGAHPWRIDGVGIRREHLLDGLWLGDFRHVLLAFAKLYLASGIRR